ncbi:ATP-dependent (S)-NAD(P)H-hydrate dehydratase [Diorhabda carinulata]|uniref:ATP-dependent (S)-NAD(P)H-hydrate dehydratase n=1 Tax=Diorhabda carinulata TaxID=1163345 RepID=UPI0025A0FE45|nr:ATP-dependent (S)-NAD(P)H-hydrate dehydratase [Diorhabda carinulata]
MLTFWLSSQISVMVTLTILSKLLTNVSSLESLSLLSARNISRTMCEAAEKKMLEKASQLAPPLTHELHKGQAGRIGVFGGSIEYTGAPYFSSISSLKVGADLAYVFSKSEAAPIIKSFSPELIVLPLLETSIEEIEPWLDRLHVVLIGPGLGRNNCTFNLIEQVIEACRNKKKPMVIDADGLFLIALKPEILVNYPAPVVLTPNVMEFNRLLGGCSDGTKLERSENYLKKLGPNIIILCKDREDEIITNGKIIKVTGGGSPRRCGGQGDLLGGSLATFLHWAILKGEEPAVACYAAARLTRECNARAFAKHGRSMTTSDMIQEIHGVFEDFYEQK